MTYSRIAHKTVSILDRDLYQGMVEQIRGKYPKVKIVVEETRYLLVFYQWRVKLTGSRSQVDRIVKNFFSYCPHP